MKQLANFTELTSEELTLISGGDKFTRDFGHAIIDWIKSLSDIRPSFITMH